MFGKREEEGIPLYSLQQEKENMKKSEFIRVGSCISDPQTSVLECVLHQDHVGLTSVLAEVAPDEDGIEASQNYPLPPDHWINQPTSKLGNFRTLLHIAIEQIDLKSVCLLLRGGARADLHNEDLGVSPVHVACQVDSLDILAELVRDPRNSGNINAGMRDGRTCLHIAAEKNRLEILQFILENKALQTVDPEDLRGRQTPLYLSVKKKNIEAVRLLLEHGAQLLNTVDNKTIREHMKENIPNFNPESVQIKMKIKERNGEDVAYSLNRILDKAQMNIIKNLPNSQELIQFKTFIQSLIVLDKKLLDSYDCGGFTFLQKSCEYGLSGFVHILLENGANPNQTMETNSTKPVLLAAYGGHQGVLQVLLQHKIDSLEGGQVVNLTVQEKTKETVLHYVLSKPSRGPRIQGGDYSGCLNLLLECKDRSVVDELNRVMNWADRQGNTALHYATQLWTQETVRKLLERGANIGVKNRWSETPISKILPETMESFLDEFCLTSTNDVQHEDFELKFRYSFLAPPVDSPNFDEHDPEGREMVENRALPETESLWYMADSPYHRHLLKHPVITSFLWMKWQRIRKYFNRGLRVYLLFVTCLSWFIFEAYGGVSYRVNSKTDTNSSSPESTESSGEEKEQSSLCSVNLEPTESRGFWYVVFILQSIIQIFMILRDWYRDLRQSDPKTAFQVLFTSWIEYFILSSIVVLVILSTQALVYILTILILMVALREVLQMMVSLKRYIFDIENLFELVMLALVCICLYVPEHYLYNGCLLKRHLAGFALVIAWATLITLVGRHPKLARYNIYVTMFYKVLKSFILFLTWYSFFIIAFGLGFYIMLHRDVPGYAPEEGEEEYKFFEDPWLALVKTGTMFIGEIEFSDIPIDLSTKVGILGYIFLICFIFLIVVVLMNLLNGLAVSDTGIIREEAEIVTYISRVETISCTEAVLLGDPFNFLANWPAIAFLRDVPSMAFCRSLYRNSLVRDISNKITGATGILLFYTWLPDKELVLQPNRRTNQFVCMPTDCMGPEIIQAAKDIVIKKTRLGLEGPGEISDLLLSLQKNQENLQDQILNLATKLDLVLTKLNTR